MLFNNLDISVLLARILVLLVAFTVHEFSHAWTANYFGDLTPKMNGRLTLNPIAHLDPIGSLLLLVAGFGWAKPVPVNPYALQRRSSSALMLVSLAGPMSNFLMAILAAIPFRAGLVSLAQAQFDAYVRGPHILPTLPQLLWEFIVINLVLMLFNLIPLAPLDGAKILDHFLPPSLARSLESIQAYGPIILMGILFIGPLVGLDIVGWVIGRPLSYILGALLG